MKTWLKQQLFAEGPPLQQSARLSAVYFGTYALAGFALTLLPAAIGSSPLIRSYALLWETVVPSVRDLVAVSRFADHARLTLTVLWTTVPFAAVAVARTPLFWIPDMTRLRRHPSLLIMAACMFGAAILSMFWLCPDESDIGGHSYFDRLVTTLSTSRLLFGPIVGLMCGTTALCFLVSFDEVVLSLFMTGPRISTLPVAMYHHVEQQADPLVAALSVLLVVLTLLVVLVVDRTSGLAKTFVK